jgi:hypothetical protein
MKRLAIVVAVVLASRGAAWAEEIDSVASSPPVVVKTLPQAGDVKVDPATTEIKVTFSKKMADKSWSWAGVDESWSPGTPRYSADGKTCVLPVKLKPGKTYVLWVNSPSYRNFKDTQGRPAIPYLLVFQTAKTSKKK